MQERNEIMTGEQSYRRCDATP